MNVGDEYISVCQFATVDMSTLPTPRRVPADPSAITVEVTPPSGTMYTRTLLAAEVVRAKAGVFYLVIPCTEVGNWGVRWVSTGVGAGAKRGTFKVDP